MMVIQVHHPWWESIVELQCHQATSLQAITSWFIFNLIIAQEVLDSKWNTLQQVRKTHPLKATLNIIAIDDTVILWCLCYKYHRNTYCRHIIINCNLHIFNPLFKGLFHLWGFFLNFFHIYSYYSRAGYNGMPMVDTKFVWHSSFLMANWEWVMLRILNWTDQ